MMQCRLGGSIPVFCQSEVVNALTVGVVVEDEFLEQCRSRKHALRCAIVRCQSRKGGFIAVRSCIQTDVVERQTDRIRSCVSAAVLRADPTDHAGTGHLHAAAVRIAARLCCDPVQRHGDMAVDQIDQNRSVGFCGIDCQAVQGDHLSGSALEGRRAGGQAAEFAGHKRTGTVIMSSDVTG